MTRQDGYLLILLSIAIYAFYSKPVPEAAIVNLSVHPTKFSFQDGE